MVWLMRIAEFRKVIDAVHKWSIFGRADLVVAYRLSAGPSFLDNLAEALKSAGATIHRVEGRRLICAVPNSKFTSFVAHRCVLEIRAGEGGQDQHELKLVATCDLTRMRRWRRVFTYGATAAVAAALLWQRIEGGAPPWWPVVVPWIGAEGGYIVARQHLREKLRNVISSLDGVRRPFGDVAS